MAKRPKKVKAKEISSCCSAEIQAASGDEGTGWYVCKDCGEACDFIFSVSVLARER